MGKFYGQKIFKSKRISTTLEYYNTAHYIIEFKAGKNLSEMELSDTASSAIQQIQSKNYSTDMEYHGVKKIGLFGIAFSGKHVAAKIDILFSLAFSSLLCYSLFYRTYVLFYSHTNADN